MNLKQSLLGLIFFFVDINSKFSMDNCTHHFENTLTSSSHANFRLAIFHSKTFLHSFWGRENALKAEKNCKIFSHLNICLHNHVLYALYVLYVYMNTFILHQVHQIHTVMNVRVAAQC